MEPAYMSERQLAAYWGISARTLQRWRIEGRGPRYVKLGRSVRYRIVDAAEFEINAATRPATAEEPSSSEFLAALVEADLSPAQRDTLLRIRSFLRTTK